jgi:putative YhdH/YhfP family quinone oxidoreductase
MSEQKFRAMWVTETAEKAYERAIVTRNVDDLPAGDVLVQVKYSSLNYKDALSAIGNKGVTRNYPHTPGIDAAGVVASSADPAFTPGDEVIVTSYDLGMNTSGGFSEYIRVPAGWVVRLPKGLTLRESMIYGTAGFTAALSVLRLVELVPNDRGEVLVSGATGGVGSIAVSILSQIGYPVVAINGIVDEAEYLRELGAKEVISIEDATDNSGRPVLKSRWAGAIDTLGGDILATTIKSVQPAGAVTCCGNVASPELPLNVFPFILRGVTLVGIDSQNCPMPYREKTWAKLAGEWKLPQLSQVVSETDLDGVSECIDRMLAGKHRGRTIVKVAE